MEREETHATAHRGKPGMGLGPHLDAGFYVLPWRQKRITKRFDYNPADSARQRHRQGSWAV